MENSALNQRRRSGSLTPSAMSRTLWSSESPPKDTLRSSNDHKAGVNVKVVLRCRPLSEEETRGRIPPVFSCDEIKRQVTLTQNSNNKQTDRNFVFDKVFGPASKQTEFYENVVGPIVSDVLKGYSWTVFAYGQTGTGKTYTMEGDAKKDKNGKFHENAGVIPRALQQIFDTLESTKRADYSMKVTYLELYNEEITDLLAQDHEVPNTPLTDKAKRSLVLMEDGRGSVFVRGLEEEVVSSADEVHVILEKGSARKHIADTLLNKQSNRSHSIFSVTVQVKESFSDGSELIKCGKLNLVDLAGSENILRSGAREGRAREAGEINKSLLTLGRVINALAEKSGHVPYRDSKLTRLLRDSLGGKTKTCMIATISPSVLSLEETISTLDYSTRAKTIKNTPEVNQKMILKSDHVMRTREINGVHVSYVPQESLEETKKQLLELQKLYHDQQQITVDLKDKVESSQKELAMTRESLLNLEHQYKREKDMNKEKENIISNLLSSGKELAARALELRSDLDGASSHFSTLYSRIEHKIDLEDRNRNHIKNVYYQLALQLDELDKGVSDSVTRQENHFKLIQDDTQALLNSKAKAVDEALKQIEKLKDMYGSGMRQLDESAEELCRNSELALRKLSSDLSNHSSRVVNLVKENTSNAETVNKGLKTKLNYLALTISTFVKQLEENHIRTYQTSKSVSQSLLNFTKSLCVYISKLRFMEEDTRSITNQKLSAFRYKFDKFALEEEKLLLEKFAELLSCSASRKKKLIEAAIDDIVECASERTKKLNEELQDMKILNTESEQAVANYIEVTERNYVEDTAKIESAKGTLEEGLQCCYTKSTEVSEQWRMNEESLLCMLKENVESVESFVKDQTESNENIYARLSSVTSSVLQHTDDATKSIMLSVEEPLRLDHEASKKLGYLSAHCYEQMHEMNSLRSQRVADISETARRSLLDDYMVDDPICLNPTKIKFNLPSKEYFIKALSGDSGVQVHTD